MRWIRFLLKLAFICNLCFLISEVLRYTVYNHTYDAVINHVLVLGIGIAFPLNGLICVVTGVLLMLKKIQWKALPPWLYLLNIIFLIVQLIVNY
ncbi:hypothetical protein SAMN05660909_05418 [Chitinophaga terrae (ex Kim and Jung 2007)]|jgi:hypothetical protein|uniref:Uncharacterized protein n=1 Tax=Chitinophaga terrae (ex Kim and Jung 2007) TaxID=408074 RepID=A0A1H4GK06_9BACT|nr:hypothetical protein SAMN05660909_05418 [Chitinophaga terrae (ex Kim and Jung 2007)]